MKNLYTYYVCKISPYTFNSDRLNFNFYLPGAIKKSLK